MKDAEFLSQTSDGHKHWRIVKSPQDGSRSSDTGAIAEEIRFTTKELAEENSGKKLVPVSYTMTSDHDGLGDGFTVTEVLTFTYQRIPNQKQNERVQQTINSNSKCFL